MGGNYPARQLAKRRAILTTKLEEQENKCPVCGGWAEVLDHDHKTGYVRGALCLTCNVGLGMFKDNAEVLVNAIEYLDKWQAEEIREEYPY